MNGATAFASSALAHVNSPPAPRRPDRAPANDSVPLRSPVNGVGTSLAEPAAASTRPAPDLSGWRSVLDRVRSKRPALASVLEHAALLRFGPDRVDLGYEASSFLVGQATEASSKELLRSACQAHFGAATEVSFETIASKNGAFTVAMLDTSERKLKMDAARRAVAEHPLVAAAIELLGAELKDVRLSAESD